MTHPKLTPRNLSARVRNPVVGNPATSRLEDGVANCFPGLELDIRTLDRRFFPGLLFSFHPVANPDVPGSDTVQGAKLDFLDYEQDPMLDPRDTTAWVQDLLAAIQGEPGAAVGDGDWYLHAVEQGGRRIEMYEYTYYENGTIRVPLEGEAVWWLVRGLLPELPLNIWLTERDSSGQPTGSAVQFHGRRRRFVTEAGVFGSEYRAGEFTASLCSPWTHDFRDCACHYWAANHPDVVLGEEVDRSSAEEFDEESTEAEEPRTYRVDWMRRDHTASGLVQAPGTIPEARPGRYDQYEINQKWEELPFVVGNREIGDEYVSPGLATEPPPYKELKKLVKVIETELAPVEVTLVAEYLYAFYSLKDPAQIDDNLWPGLADGLRFARQAVRMVAVSEMQHIRWSNQILWMLDQAGLFPRKRHYSPIVTMSDTIPTNVNEPPRPRELKPLSAETLADFIAVERPTDAIFTTYAKTIASLREHAPGAADLALRIDRDGLKHYERFTDVQTRLSPYDRDGEPPPYLNDIVPARPDNTSAEVWQMAENAVQQFQRILQFESMGLELESAGRVREAEESYVAGRLLMSGNPESFDALATELARSGFGVPFW